MIYVVGRKVFYDENQLYTFFESNTESFFTGSRDDFEVLRVMRKMHLKNVHLSSDELTDRVWFDHIHCKHDGIEENTDYILMCKTDEGTFKLASYEEKVSYVNYEQLEQYIKKSKVANCKIENGRIRSIGTYKILKDEDLIEQTAEKYRTYEAKSIMLGRKMSFEYSIEGQEVKLIKYTGTDKDVIVPKFITTIMPSAFKGCGIEAITLESGLKYIGNSAFEGCNLSEITLPETAEFVGAGAFHGNKHLVSSVIGIIRKRVKLLNKRTTVLDMPNKAAYESITKRFREIRDEYN